MPITSAVNQDELFKNEYKGLRKTKPKDNVFAPVYKHLNGTLFEGDSIEWLKSLDTESVDLIFADPPYNIKKADWDKFETQEIYIDWSMQWISEAHRVLKKKVLYMFVVFLRFLQI